ncbi:MAG: lysophospholipid acyltransferase family protein [Candidatus Latescibacteria bacterium]|nr:lysophospholipid acyltransferase family protein [Candidatus Latescibacterota bacterium]
MAKQKFVKKLRKDSAYVLILVIVGFFRFLPRSVALFVGSVLGRIASMILLRERKLAEEHLTLAFGNEKDMQEIRRLAKEMFRYLALNFVDMVRLNIMSTKQIEDMCIVHNLDHIKEEHGKGKGLIALSGHIGCWEVMGSWLPTVGIKPYAIAKKLYDHRLETLLFEAREREGMTVISRGENTRDILRAFKKGHLVGMLVDQDTDVKSVFVDFFGHPAYTPSGPAFLSLRFGVPIVPLFIYRDDNHYHHICVGETVSIEPTGDMVKDITELTAKAACITEDFIREHPEQWVWFHKRWKTRPDTIKDEQTG